MGRSSHTPEIRHHGHTHPLHHTPASSSSSPCACCSHPTAGAHTYTCKACRYSLHTACATLPDLLRHPSHLHHVLHLLYTPAYPEGSFSCDACGLTGTAFSYHCIECDIDLHPLCAFLPSTLLHPAHFHNLGLSFSPPYDDGNYVCDACGEIGAVDQWLYRCSLGCEFDAHVGCVVAAAPAKGQRFKLVVAPRSPVVVCTPPKPQGPVAPAPVVMGQVVGYSPRPMSLFPDNNPAGRRDSFGRQLFQGAAQGFVEGVAQQLGSNVGQAIFGGNNGGQNANNDPSTTVVVELQSTEVNVNYYSGTLEDNNHQDYSANGDYY